ncbi:hypothetical protein M434DRAFT_402080 [Hypoxylon sp. CO27-5]|nr:hypothetical protein M434DRAFT_402080 [Hypoxylon sp. CO27-5]
MSARQRIRDIIDATRDRISDMSGRYRITPLDFDLLYQLYQEDTSAKGLYEFIVDHPITHGIAGRLSIRPIDVLASMVGKTADVCQEELEAGTYVYRIINIQLEVTYHEWVTDLTVRDRNISGCREEGGGSQRDKEGQGLRGEIGGE